MLCSKLSAPALESLSLDELTTTIIHSPIISQAQRLAQLELAEPPSGITSSRKIEDSLISINYLSALCLTWSPSVHSFIQALSNASVLPPLPHLQGLTLMEMPFLRRRTLLINGTQSAIFDVQTNALHHLLSSSDLEDIASLVAVRSGPHRPLVGAAPLDDILIQFKEDDGGCTLPSGKMAMWTAMELGTRAEIKAFNRFRSKLFSEMRVVKHLPNVINEDDTHRWEALERGYRDVPAKWLVVSNGLHLCDLPDTFSDF